MTMRRRYVLVCGLLLAAATTFCLLAWRPREPVYKGRTLHYWLRGYRAGGQQWNDSNQQLADEAVRHFGTNSFPILLEMVTARETAASLKLVRWSVKWRRWARKLPFVKIAPYPRYQSYDAVEASHAFRTLGPQASNAVPALVRLLDQDLPPPNHEMILGVLGFIGPSAKEAVTAVLRDLRAPDPSYRENAFFALCHIHPESELVVTNAIQALSDGDYTVCAQAAKALEMYGAEAKPAVPALLEMIQKWSGRPFTPRRYPVFIYPDEAAKEALKAIDPEAALKAGVK